MSISTVHPQNYVVGTTTQHNENRNCSPTKRCMWVFIPTIIVILILIAAIVIPLVITKNCNKDTSPSTIGNETSSQTITTSSSLSSNDTFNITTTEIMAVADNSTHNSQSIENGTTSTPNIDNGTIKTTTNSVDTSTYGPMIALNQENDTIVSLYNTTAGESTGGSNDSYSPSGQLPKYAMDGLLRTKYLNFGHKGGPGKNVNGPGIGTGFLVIPSISNSTLACGLLFATANDSPQRDPITVTLEGSNTTNLTILDHGSSWTLIYNGSTGINETSHPGFQTYGMVQIFSNTERYSSYRLLITSQRGIAGAVQYSEARIMGYI